MKKIKKVLAFLKELLYNNSCLKERTYNLREARLAQLVEHLTLNQGVQGSNPWRRTYESLMIWSLEPGCGAFIFCIENI